MDILSQPESLTLTDATICMVSFINKYPIYTNGLFCITQYLKSLDDNVPFFHLELVSIICYLYNYSTILYSSIEYLSVRKDKYQVYLLLKLKDKEEYIIGYIWLIKLLYSRFEIDKIGKIKLK